MPFATRSNACLCVYGVPYLALPSRELVPPFASTGSRRSVAGCRATSTLMRVLEQLDEVRVAARRQGGVSGPTPLGYM